MNQCIRVRNVGILDGEVMERLSDREKERARREKRRGRDLWQLSD